MKRVITTAGLAVLGVMSATAASSTETTKPWSVSAALRGFYDDNYATRNKAVGKEGSGGFEVNPVVGFNIFREQTSISLTYSYDLRYYLDRDGKGVVGGATQTSGKDDQSHEVTAKLSHVFTPRLKLDLSDSFAFAQEPQILAKNGAAAATFLRNDGENFRNFADIAATLQITDTLSTVVGYDNSYWDYKETGNNSNSARLDRMEHLGRLEMRYQFQPSTVGLLGYEYGATDYSDDKDLLTSGAFTAAPKDRNFTSHKVVLGAEHTFNSQLSGSVRGGVQITDYTKLKKSETSPYAKVQGQYTYAEGSSLTLGLVHERSASDVALFDTAGVVGQNSESTSLYAVVHHQITAKLSADLIGQYQNTAFQFGGGDGKDDDYYGIGISAAYEINKFLSLEAGYNYDRLTSGLDSFSPRSYSRNRVFAGIKAAY